MAAERSSLKKFFEPRLFVQRFFQVPLKKFKLLNVPCGHSVVLDNLHSKSGEVDVPRFNQRIQEGDAVFYRQVKDSCIQELENEDPHLGITSVAEPSHPAEPVLIFQFLFSDSLDHVQKFLGDEALEFAEGLLLKDGAYLCFFVRVAFGENQLSDFFIQGAGWVPQFSLQLFPMLEVSELRKLTARELQQFADLLVKIGASRRGGQFFLSQQL